MSQAITQCRATGTRNLVRILSLGEQCLTGVFPARDRPDPSASPLELVLAQDEEGCNLVQLRHNADIQEMYGATYGYHSSISPTMISHLKSKFDHLLSFVDLRPGELVLDIGCNDGTFLNFYEGRSAKRYGIDPSSEKFRKMFHDDVSVAYDFFSESRVRQMSGDQQYRIISSIAMFYDADDPIRFMQDVERLLQEDGVWLVEVAYLPMMMRTLAYDQVMHEHLTYLGLTQMKHMMDQVGLAVLDVTTNYINGGSLSIIAGKRSGPYQPNQRAIDAMLEAEKPLQDIAAYRRFESRVMAHRDEVRAFFRLTKAAGLRVYGYGASTKGNVVMNYCAVGPEDLVAICDRNPEKHGLATPQTRIPIISQEQMRKAKPDYLFVNIWHLRREALLDEADFIKDGGTMVFSLPRLHTVDAENYERVLESSFDDLAYEL